MDGLLDHLRASFQHRLAQAGDARVGLDQHKGAILDPQCCHDRTHCRDLHLSSP